MMILIADSGSTKTTWYLSGEDIPPKEIATDGMNPYLQSEDNIQTTLLSSLLPQLTVDPAKIDAVYFYGAGCIFEKVEIVSRAIRKYIPADVVEVNSDLLAAARGLFGREPGIACILGTGSNSCFYDGENIIRNISALGFILGDEGSGSSLGKHLVGDLLKDMFPTVLKEKFLRQFNLTPAEIIDRVYRQPFPNRFLAGLSSFISENFDEPGMKQLVHDDFKAFFVRNLMKYDYQQNKASFVGSIAYHYKDILREVAKDMGISLGIILQSPMEGLIKYHSGK